MIELVTFIMQYSWHFIVFRFMNFVQEIIIYEIKVIFKGSCLNVCCIFKCTNRQFCKWMYTDEKNI